MTESKGAPPPERKSWNKGEWEAKAKEKDQRYQDQAKSAEAAMQQGRKPKYQDEDLPKPTKNLEQRTESLQLDKNLNKTQLVQTTTSGKGPRGPGFYCELCDRTLKDSLSYLDHLNSRYHLRHLGQTTTTARSTLTQVRARIALLRQQSASKVTSKNYDFNARLRAVREADEAARTARREERKRKRAEKRAEVEDRDRGGRSGAKRRNEGGDQQDNIAMAEKDRIGSGVAGVGNGAGAGTGPGGGNGHTGAGAGGEEEDDMMAMMGFGGFASSKR